MTPQSKKETRSGSTINTYTDLDFLSLPWARTRVLLKNTHGSYSLDYRVWGYMESADLTDSGAEITAETALAFGNTYTTLITDPWHIIRVSVKSTVGGNHPTYKIFVNRMEA